MGRLVLHEDRLFPRDAETRAIARRLFAGVRDLPIISPHGHTDPSWFALDEPFGDATSLLIQPDHYVFRMLYSQGINLEQLGINPVDGSSAPEAANVEVDPREAWRLFARNYHLFHGTPSRIWHDWVYSEVFGLEETLSESTADQYFDRINEKLGQPDFRPRALFERFNIEVIATTEDPLDPLIHHAKLKEDGWGERVITTFRPDNVLDPEYEDFAANVSQLGKVTGCDVSSYGGYLEALRERRRFFREHGATATDHGHPTAATHALTSAEAEELYLKVIGGGFGSMDAEVFRGHMLIEMARMSLDDGMVMQIHPGSFRNHNRDLFRRFGRDKGADIPQPTDYVTALKPLLDEVGNEASLTIIVFTLDETVYSRELAPLAGHYPALRLGPPWWFHDSPEGMRRFREQSTETAGFYNTVGFNDDTRAFLSIPARHDVARRLDCAFLARLVAEHRLHEDGAQQLAHDLTYNLAKQAYRL